MKKKRIYVTTGKGVGRAASDGQGRWESDIVLENQDVRCLAADPLQRGVIYAGTQGSGLFRSSDFGQTWQPAGLGGEVVKDVAAPGSLVTFCNIHGLKHRL
jgi:hypothetical protein